MKRKNDNVTTVDLCLTSPMLEFTGAQETGLLKIELHNGTGYVQVYSSQVYGVEDGTDYDYWFDIVTVLRNQFHPEDSDYVNHRLYRVYLEYNKMTSPYEVECFNGTFYYGITTTATSHVNLPLSPSCNSQYIKFLDSQGNWYSWWLPEPVKVKEVTLNRGLVFRNGYNYDMPVNGSTDSSYTFNILLDKAQQASFLQEFAPSPMMFYNGNRCYLETTQFQTNNDYSPFTFTVKSSKNLVW